MHDEDLMAPPDLLCPIWRCMPNHGSGVFTIALDPREAEHVLGNGYAFLDGVKYTVGLSGCSGEIDGDGRIMVRCVVANESDASFLTCEAEAMRRQTYHDYLDVETESLA